MRVCMHTHACVCVVCIYDRVNIYCFINDDEINGKGECVDLLKFSLFPLSLNFFALSLAPSFYSTEWNRAGEFRKPLLINPSHSDN